MKTHMGTLIMWLNEFSGSKDEVVEEKTVTLRFAD